MPITTLDIVFRAAATVADTAANGGHMSATAITSGRKNAVFPDVRNAERSAGATHFRKVFVHFAPADDSPALDVRVLPWAATPAGDSVTLHPASLTDTQGQIGAARAYGVAAISAGATPGSTVLTVALEDPEVLPFVAGDTLFVTNKLTPEGAGSEEFVRLAAVTASGGSATLTLASGLVHGHAPPTRVASVLPIGDVLTAVRHPVLQSAAGSFDAAAVVLASASTIAQTVTLTFSSATAFAAVGSVSGSLGSGTRSASFAPNNAPFGGPHFTLPAAAWGGNWAAGDTLSFDTVPAAFAVWQRRRVPAGTPAFSDNGFTMLVDLETV